MHGVGTFTHAYGHGGQSGNRQNKGTWGVLLEVWQSRKDAAEMQGAHIKLGVAILNSLKHRSHPFYRWLCGTNV